MNENTLIEESESKRQKRRKKKRKKKKWKCVRSSRRVRAKETKLIITANNQPLPLDITNEME